MSGELIAGYVIGVATGLTVEGIKAISPFLAASLPGQPSALDAWMQLRGNQRLEDLLYIVQRLESENKELKQTISEEEKLSPGSGYTKTLQEYITTPVDEKIEYLRNALLNGLYGDFSAGRREYFYRLVGDLQPVDVKILKYLCDVCPNVDYYVAVVREGKLKNPEREKLQVLTSLTSIPV